MPDSIADAAGRTAVADLRAFLRGAWHLERDLEDRRAATRGRLAGRAVFAPDGAAPGAGLRYREAGELAFAGHRGAFYRVYLYRFPRPGRAEVAFDDGRPFHALDLTRGAWAAVHRCGDDLYEGRFAATGADAWRAVWRVTGPRKDLVLTSRYRRLGAGPCAGPRAGP